ncbi:pentatricopeptide repeat-containing protein At2g37320-like [Cryptomeria japonica]|uniref:pentatricopeptide repeat-containing protein At2g37320-like n=1 Tax=Cryptomeria japonica TaxID=3369 RepID=UPI0025AC78EB|nr:pentatricopeptide repeat-containing protein At2g37320-like [Cryptomeria japonica]
MGSLELGMEIHRGIIQSGLLRDVLDSNSLDVHRMVLWTRLFETMPRPNVVSWIAVNFGHAQNSLVEKALEFFGQMQSTGVKPNSTTFSSVLTACAKAGVLKQGMCKVKLSNLCQYPPSMRKLGALEQGMEMHQKIIESGFWSDVIVTNALIDMYAKCGSIKKAWRLFDKMHHPDFISWTAMVAGYAMHGYSTDVLKLFELIKLS